ncbi:MAG: curli assembly protein CsgF [Alphaproteobacteria bacterium]|nr:curli assembly protein CsgF [Alphaproteobacteria bacterium]
MSDFKGFRSVGWTCCTALALTLVAGATAAQDLNFGFNNPSFGGNPGYTTHLFATANAQRTATARNQDTGGALGGNGTGGDTTGGDTRADLFVRQLEGRLLSALSAEVTAAIFGENQQDSGTVQFGDTTITFDRTAAAITLDIINVLDGTSTTITVPQLITNTTN